MNRTTALAASLAVICLLAPLSGCLGGVVDEGTGPATTTTADTTTAGTTTTTADRTTRGSYRAVTVAAEPIAPADLLADRVTTVDGIDPDARSTVRRLLARSNHTVATTHLGHDGHLADGTYVRDDGTIYRIDRTVTDTRAVLAHEFRLSGPVREDADEYGTASDEAVAFEDLPDADREAFLAGLPPEEDRRRAASFTVGYLHRFANGTLPEETVLADGQVHYVEYRGEYYRVDGGEEQRTTRYRLEYEAVPVSDAPGEFADTLTGRLAVPVGAVATDDGQRSLLLAAIETGEKRWEGTTGDVPESYAGLRERIDEHPPERGVVYVRHDGDLYRVTVTVVVA